MYVHWLAVATTTKVARLPGPVVRYLVSLELKDESKGRLRTPPGPRTTQTPKSNLAAPN